MAPRKDIVFVKKETLKARITNVRTQVDGHIATPIPQTQIEFLLTRLSSTLEENEDNTNLILQQTEKEDYSGEMKTHDELESEIYTLMSKLRQMQISSSTTGGAKSGDSESAQINLPRLELPTFDGSIHDWISFKNQYEQAIHNNKQISNIAKFNYLRAQVKGDAANLIKSIPISDENYNQAWKALSSRYAHRREMIFAHLNRISDLPILLEENQAGLRRLIDTSMECVGSLKILGEEVDSWDTVLVYWLRKKLHEDLRHKWELSLTDDSPPELKAFIEFLEHRARALPSVQNDSSNSKSNGNQGGNKNKAKHQGKARTHLTSSNNSKCPACKAESHPLFKCQAFTNMSTTDREKLVKFSKLCINCLRFGHRAVDCRNQMKCRTCQRSHHTMLHRQTVNVNANNQSSQHTHPVQPATASAPLPATKALQTGLNQREEIQMVMGTALVFGHNSNNLKIPCRVLQDSCSKVSIISEACVKKLQLRRKHNATAIYGVGNNKTATTKGMVSIRISSRTSNYTTTLDALIVPKITSLEPLCPFTSIQWASNQDLELADPNYNKPGEIDILLDLKTADQIWLGNQYKDPDGQFILRQSVFGWIFSGQVRVTPSSHSFITILHTHASLNSTLIKFWKMEDLPNQTNILTREEQACEEHFIETHHRDAQGRFVVELPFRQNIMKYVSNENPGLQHSLGQSRDSAIRRFMQLERRFAKNIQMKTQYVDYMNELVKLEMLKLVTQEEMDIPAPLHYYIPHHAVYKGTSTTTKLRPVNDASAKTQSGISLNDLLSNGPKIQKDLFCIFLEFRTHEVAVTGDIAKFYPKNKVVEAHTHFQRIVWREDVSNPIQDYKYTGLTFGTGPAAYLSVRCLQQLGLEEQTNHPQAARAILNQFYIDDLLSGGKSVEDTITLILELIHLLKKAKYELRKIASSHPRVMEAVPIELRATENSMKMDKDHIIKTLGIEWHPCEDVFTFSINFSSSYENITRRIMLSEIARVYDPLGWLSPIQILRKCIMQELWSEEHVENGWDKPVSGAVLNRWLRHSEQLHLISRIKIPRCIITPWATKFQLCGFADASQSAYAAVVYIRSQDQDSRSSVKLVAAKTRVAPMKKITIPRLELCAAELLSHLLVNVQKSLNLEIEETHAWSDSMIVLHWINSSPHRWQTFVANRVARIQNLLPLCKWHHVLSEDNPADCASRGCTPSEFIKHPLWWTGPLWLEDSIVDRPLDLSPSLDLEAKKTRVTCFLQLFEDSVMHHYSKLSKLLIITSYCLRFIYNCKCKCGPKNRGPFMSQDREDALLHWINYVQGNEFPDEIRLLKKKDPVAQKSSLSSLNPFIDEKGIIRVGGRLEYAFDKSQDEKHPILLPRKHFLTTLIVRDCHQNNFHCGARLLLSTLRQKYWILCGQDVVKRFLKKCVVCLRYVPTTTNPMMGNLPKPRVSPSSPFTHTGVDYAGPIILRNRNGRGHACYKAYIAVFVCLSTKAIHLEVASDGTTEAFIAALRRFISRSGKPSDLYSDNGPNFKGANNSLREMLIQETDRTSKEKLQAILLNRGINWHFNPAVAPHFGGLWEAAVKSTKSLLKKLHIEGSFTYEEMSTILNEIESCLNSRPLCKFPCSDPNDVQALTPGHFLIGRPLNSLPDRLSDSLKSNKLDRWVAVQNQVQQFWRQWSLEYLAEMQERNKWKVPVENINIGAVVILRNASQPPATWSLGRIAEVYPGRDGVVRAVTVQVNKSNYRRPINQVIILPINDE